MLTLGILTCRCGFRITLRGDDLLIPLRGHLAFDRLGLERSDLHTLILHGLLRTGRAVPFLLGNLYLRTVDRLSGGTFSDRLDVPALVGDVSNVHVDQRETDLVDLLGHVGVDQGHELLTVLVDLLDRQRRDNQAQLTKDDILGLLLDLLLVEKQQPLGRHVHQSGVGRNADGERRGDVHANIVE